MNQWVKRSIDLANSPGYLDKLFKVYPVELGSTRELSDHIEQEFKKAFQSRNGLDLIASLLKFPKFPIDDPYISSLRRYPDLLEKNPKTVERLASRLLKMDRYTILLLATRPKSPTRQLGQTFKNWIGNLPFPFLKAEDFMNNNKIAFLDDSEKELKKFAINILGVNRLKRRPDFVLKTKDRFIVAESKFLTDYGGSQNNQFDGALGMTKLKTGKILGIAVLDGVVWFKSSTYMYKKIKSLNGIALSSLLLKEFIEESYRNS